MTVTLSRSLSLSNRTPKEFFGKMIVAGFPGATPEYRFHETRKWKIDWFIPSIKVGIEIEGGIWIKGRHTRPSGFVKDMEKYNTAAMMGIKIYRISHDDLKSARKILDHFSRIKNYAALV